jgi:hypothetical protein
MMPMAVISPPVELPVLHLPKGLSQFTSRLLMPDDQAVVLRFRQHIFATLPAQFRLADPQAVAASNVSTAVQEGYGQTEARWAQLHLSRPGITLGVFHRGQLVAYASLLLPGCEAEGGDLSRLLNLSGVDTARSAHMAACMVAEDFRGLRLQSKLLAWRRECAVRANRSLLLGMTACGNRYSLRNMLDAGLCVRWVGEIRPGRWWHVLALDLQLAPHTAVTQHEWVRADDYRRQAQLTGLGFEGVADMTRPGWNATMDTFLDFAARHRAMGDAE